MIEDILGGAVPEADTAPVRDEPVFQLRPPWETHRMPGSRDITMMGAGAVTFAFTDVMMMMAPLRSSDDPSLLPQFVTLALLAFGLGGVLIRQVGGKARLFGIGMMLSWVFLTLISAGLLTGIRL